jgi:hypothetical protein
VAPPFRAFLLRQIAALTRGGSAQDPDLADRPHRRRLGPRREQPDLAEELTGSHRPQAHVFLCRGLRRLDLPDSMMQNRSAGSPSDTITSPRRNLPSSRPCAISPTRRASVRVNRVRRRVPFVVATGADSRSEDLQLSVMNHHDLSARATAAPGPGIWPLTVAPPLTLMLSPIDRCTAPCSAIKTMLLASHADEP